MLRLNSQKNYNTYLKAFLIMQFWFLAAAIPYGNLVVAVDSVWDITSPAEDNTLGIDIGETTLASSNNLFNSERTSNLFLNSEAGIASSNIFLDPEGTGSDEATIALSDNFLDLKGNSMTWTDSFLGSSEDTNTFWSDKFLSTDASLQTSCVTRTDEFRLEARDGESCAVPQPEFQLPSSLQRLYEDPFGLVEDSLGPKRDGEPNGDDEPWIPRIYAEGDSDPKIPPIEVLRKLLIEEPCGVPSYRINLCCDGPAEESTDVPPLVYNFYSIVYNCDPGTLCIPKISSCCTVLDCHPVSNLHYFLQVFTLLVKENMVFVVSGT